MTAVDHDHAARLVTHLSQQRSSGKYCDVCVCVAEQRFLAHKCILSANSDQLDALILDATDEDNASHDIEIEIHGVSPVGFEIVLEYFYTGVLRLEPLTVTHTWMTAVYLGLPDIISRCNIYCQQSVSLTAAQTKAATVPSLVALPASQTQDTNATGNTASAQLSTSTVQSSASKQPKVNSTVKTKTQNLVQANTDAGKGGKPQPFEIRENRNNADNSKTRNGETTNKKAKFLNTDESEISWNYGHQNSTAVAAPPITSVPQVVVNLVQGYGAYQPVDINTWNGSGTPQQWAQVQVGGKGQMVTTGVIPFTQQVKHETSRTPTPSVQLPTSGVSSQNSVESAPGAEDNSQKSYTTLSLVSQDSQESESKNNGDTTSAEIATPVPATPAPSESNQIIQESLLRTGTTAQSPAVIPAPELNLDSIQFTQINTDDKQHRPADAPTATTTGTFVQPIAMINNLQFVGDGTKCETMLMQSEVEQLRIQHQQLQRLRQLETGENGESPSQGDAMQAILATSKRKRKAPTRVAKSEDGTGDTHELHAHSNIRKSRSLADSVLVTITPEHMEYLYQKYPEIKQEPPISGTCDVMQLLQHGKARQRKSSEQNALNNNIRTILDTTGIVESGDTRVQDAVCLIMDRFTVLQEHMNDAYVRKQLTIKVKHSIHCKKWRLKRHKIKQLEMSSSSSPDAQAWMLDPNTSNISISSNNSLLNEDTFSEIRKSVGSNNSLLSQENLSEMRTVVSPNNNSLLNDESLHS